MKLGDLLDTFEIGNHFDLTVCGYHFPILLRYGSVDIHDIIIDSFRDYEIRKGKIDYFGAVKLHYQGEKEFELFRQCLKFVGFEFSDGNIISNQPDEYSTKVYFPNCPYIAFVTDWKYPLDKAHELVDKMNGSSKKE